MKENQRTTSELMKAWKNGEFDSPDMTTQIEAGWYDWFCRDSSLAAKTKRLYAKAERILKTDQLSKMPKINPDKTYIWFKNNCPMFGHLYDDFRFADIKTGDVLFTVTPSSGHDSDFGEAELWGKVNGFKEPLVKGTWKDILAYFSK